MPVVERYPYVPQHLHATVKHSPHLSFPCDTRKPIHHNLVMGISILIQNLVRLTELTLNWECVPSSVLSTITANLTYFESNMEIDDTLISFLNAQREITVIDLKNWGSHLPPRSGSTSSQKAPSAPMELASSSLPHLAEFIGHADVASQLASSRPLKAVSLTSGFDASTSGEDWREIMSGLGESTHWLSHLSVGPLPSFSLEMLAAVGRHLQALETLHISVQRYPYSQVSHSGNSLYLVNANEKYLNRKFFTGITGRTMLFPLLSWSRLKLKWPTQLPNILSICPQANISTHGIGRVRYLRTCS